MNHLNSLISAKNYRAFLEKALAVHFADKKPNLAEFSRRANFSSRSYLSELLNGKKGLSRDSLNRIKTSLKLPSAYLQYFELLAKRDEPTLRSRRDTDLSIRKRIEECKVQIASVDSLKSEPKRTKRILAHPNIFKVYASLGTLSDGANLNEILQRSRLPESNVNQVLKVLLENEVIRMQDDRYFVTTKNLDLLDLKPRQGLEELGSAVCADLQRKMTNIVKSESDAVYYFAFSLRSADRKIVKQKLREAILRVLDEHQDDAGDYVEQLFVSLY